MSALRNNGTWPAIRRDLPKQRLLALILPRDGRAAAGSPNQPKVRTESTGEDHAVRPAASRINCEITSGCDIRDRLPAFTSMVLAPILFAMNRSRSGLIVLSSVETA